MSDRRIRFPLGRLIAVLTRLDRVAGLLLRWSEGRAIMRVPALLGRLSVVVVAITYVMDAPKREQAQITDALTTIAAAAGQPLSDARQRALLLLNSKCISIAGLNLEAAELPGIDLRPCSVFDPGWGGDGWPTLYAPRPFAMAHVRLAGANLRGARLDGVDLSDADLSRADLRGAVLRGADLRRANLRGVRLQGADLRDVRASDARMALAELDQARAARADLSRADLSGAVLIGADLAHADLAHATLTGANLNRANLCGALLYRAHLARARLNNADFTDAMLLGVTPERIAIEPPGPARLALLVSNPDDVFFAEVRAGIETFLRQTRAKPRIGCAPAPPGTMTLVAVRGTSGRGELEKQEIEALIRDKIDAIILAQTSNDGLPALVRDAYRAGIAVVCFDSCNLTSNARDLFAGRFDSDQTALGRAAGVHLAGLLRGTRRDKPIRLGVLHCGGFAENCYERYLGFTTALTNGGILWRLSGFQEGWNDTNAPPAAAKLLADDPDIDVLWAANGPGTEAIALAAADLPRKIHVIGTDISPRLRALLRAPAKNPLLGVVAQSPGIMGECSAAAALAALSGQGPDVLPAHCQQPIPLQFHPHS